MTRFIKEIYRKIIHLASLAMPILYCLTDQVLAIKINVCFLFLMAVFEYFRLVHSKTAITALHFFKLHNIIREHEARNLTGASYMSISSMISILAFSKEVYISAFAILAISDSFAAIVGMKYGRIKILNKTLEGSLAFLLSSLCCVLVIYYYSALPITFLYFGALSCIPTTIAELIAKKIRIDDNFMIPLTFGCSISIFSMAI